MDEYRRRRRLQKKAFKDFGPPISTNRFPITLNTSLIDFSKELEGIMRVMNGHYVSLPYTPVHIDKERLDPSIHSNLVKDVGRRAGELSKENIRESFLVDQKIPHKLEFIAKVDGVTYIDNSRSTCVNSTWFALEEQNSPVVWIVGGLEKENNDYSIVSELVKKKVKVIICLGEENEKIHTMFGNFVSCIITAYSMKDCIGFCRTLAKEGDTVLLSPACASFGMFDDYIDRGKQFKKLVMSL